jgi:uncharacterized protein (DUF1778 family)
MKLDPEETVLLSDEQIDRINDICDNPPVMTDYLRQYINAYRKQNETKTPKGS